MGYQALQGVRVTPRGSYNLSRFSNTFEGKSWPTSFGWGGWIYNADCNIGFSNTPTEITLNIVLEADERQQMSSVFNINTQDLRMDAGDGNDENLYDINFNGINFTDFVLYSYDISIEAGSKVLTVVLKDYSVILDKIYVGLLKRQGNKFVRSAVSEVRFPVNCPDCQLNGSSFVQHGVAYRDINYGSYCGINGSAYDNFEGLSTDGNVYRRWEKLFQISPSSVKFDLNGGYVIIGTEDITEEKCGDLGGISYTFNQLLATLRYRGIILEGAFPQSINESDFAYRQNYIGTLREVLQQWCSDLGLDFFCNGKRFVGINISKSLDIQKITEIADPTTELGQNFALNKNTAILSYKESNSIENSYRQSIITANTRPRQSKIHTKSPKRYVGFIPLHPVDFNIPNRNRIERFDLFGNSYSDFAWANSFEPGSTDLSRNLYQLDNRTFEDVDTAIALSHYDSDLRDIYCQDKAIYGGSEEIRAANFKALGFIPLIEISNSYDKSVAIESVFGSAGDEVQNICLDSRYYKVYIGYSYSKLKEDIVRWEQSAGDSMYKYGALTKGLMQGLPYIPSDVINDISPAAGLYGNHGTSTTKITHAFEPNAEQYYELYEAPFKDIILYSGLRNRGDYFPEQLYIGELSNDWGTTQEQFKRELSLRLDDACVQEYANTEGYTQLINNVEKKFQDWKLNLFKPQTISNLDSFFEQYLPLLKKIDPTLTQLDRTVQAYYDTNYQESNTCAKLHIIVLTDTRTHPNIYIDFTKRAREFINPVVLQKYREKEKEAIKRRSMTKTPSLCDKTLLQEMCDGLIVTSGNAYSADPRFSCATEEEAENYEEGFDLTYLSSPNSRGLDVRIVKNPVRNTDTDSIQHLYRSSDINGSFYFTDTLIGYNDYQQKQATISIIYPISVDADENIHYKGIMSSEIEIENRSPEIVEIFGEPVNTTNNRSAGLKIINNTVDPDLQPQLDPLSSRFVSYLTVITGDDQTITTVSGYHDFIKKLNNYDVTGVNKSIELSLAGTPDYFGSFSGYLSPIYGLTKMSISVTDNGVVTALSYSDRPPVLPRQESVLNKIGPRII
jgi:hypothetical protein